MFGGGGGGGGVDVGSRMSWTASGGRSWRRRTRREGFVGTAAGTCPLCSFLPPLRNSCIFFIHINPKCRMNMVSVKVLRGVKVRVPLSCIRPGRQDSP